MRIDFRIMDILGLVDEELKYKLQLESRINMILVVEIIVVCVLFTIMVYIMSREPIKILYNYQPKIQERVKSLDEYKDKIPTQKNNIWI